MCSGGPHTARSGRGCRHDRDVRRRARRGAGPGRRPAGGAPRRPGHDRPRAAGVDLPLRPRAGRARGRPRRPRRAVRAEQPGCAGRPLRRAPARRRHDVPVGAARAAPARRAPRTRRPATCWWPSPRRRTCCRPGRRPASPRSGATCPAPRLRLDGLAAAASATRCPAGPARTTSPWSSPPAARPVCRRAAGATFAALHHHGARRSRPDRRQLANGPLAHLTQLLVDTTLLGGGTVVLQDEVEPAATLAAIESARITDLFLVEPQLFAVIDHPDVATRDLSSLRAVVHIGASAPATLRRAGPGRLGAGGRPHLRGQRDRHRQRAPARRARPPDRFACAGRPVPGVEVRFRRDRRHARRTGRGRAA